MSNCKLLFILLITLTVITLNAQKPAVVNQQQTTTKGATLFGKVVDEATGEILRGATVQLIEAKKGANTDIKGEFKIKNVTPDKYTIKISYVGYQTKEVKDFIVKPSGNPPVTFALASEAKTTGEVVVSANRIMDNDVAMLSKRKNADQVSDGVSSEEIKKLPDSDAGQALKRVSGVTLVGDKFVFVRGTSERYSNTTLNGASLATTEPDKKAFAFDLFPSDFLENANIAKSFTPDLPGNFAGGLVQLNTIEFPSASRVKVSIGTSAITNTTFQDSKFATYQGGSSDIWGIDDGTRALPNNPDLTQSGFAQLRQDLKKDYSSEPFKLYQLQQRYENVINSFNNNNWIGERQSAPMNTGLTISYSDIFEIAENDFGVIASLAYNNSYNYQDIQRASMQADYISYDDIRVGSTSVFSTNLGGIFNLAYKIGGHSSISLKNTLNVSSDDETTLLEGRNLTGNQDYKHYGFNFVEKRIIGSQLGGEHKFEQFNNASMDWKIGFSQSLRDEPDFRRMRFSRNDSSAAYTSDIITASGSGFGYNAGRFYSNLQENAYSAGLNINIPIDNLKIKVGFNYETKARDFTVRSMTYVPTSTIMPNSVRNRFDVNGDGVLQPFDWNGDGRIDTTGFDKDGNLTDGIIVETEFETERYGKQLSQDSIQRLNRIFDGNMSIMGIGISEDSREFDSYKATEDVLGVYMMATLPFEIEGEKFKTIFGVRNERSSQILSGFARDTNFANQNFNDLLPSINLVYELNSETNIRASVTRTLTRPSLREYAPFTFYDFAYKMNVRGNEGLQRALITNYDLRYEFYPAPTELVSVSAFYKNFENAIEEVVERTGNALRRTFQNSPSNAFVYGLEFEFRKSLKFIDDEFENFAINTNVSVIRSEVTVPAVIVGSNANSITRPMWGQSPYTVNAGLYYSNPETGTNINLGYNVYGRRIIQVSNPADFTTSGGQVNERALNAYELPRHVIDFNFTQRFGDLELKFVVRDILAQDLVWNQGLDIADVNTVSRNIRGANYSLGISYVFNNSN